MGVDCFHPHEDLYIHPLDNSQDSAGGAHITAIPGRVIRHDSALKPLHQFSDGHLVGQHIDIARVNRQPAKGERGTPAHGPQPAPDGGKTVKRFAPRRTRASHAPTIGLR